ncbi:MAG: phospholipase D-like domain-containing protein [Armatimonadota bacterium]
MSDIEFITDKEIYEQVILDKIPDARQFLWIATSDMKDLYVSKGKRMVPFLRTLSDMVDKNVAIRILHAKEPGPAFREDFDKYPNLLEGIERILCPRVHFKAVVVDGVFAYTGSANLTGAGMGAKSGDGRNFESGIITTNTDMIQSIMNQFDDIWIGRRCEKCRRKKYCTDFGAILMIE